MAVMFPPDLLDRIRRLEQDVRELRGRLPAPPTNEPATDAAPALASDADEA